MDLTVANLSVTRGGIPVLEGVSFALRAGQALVLRGPNGSGKTTFLRTIAGLQRPLGGTQSIGPDHMAYAAHADGLKATLTVHENLSFWARVFGMSDIQGAVQAFELEPLVDRTAGTLSAGQKRRLGLARLLVTGRPVWILDEPTVSLDAAAVTLFTTAIRAHLATGGMAVIATHIDLGLDEAQVLDITRFKARMPAPDDFDGAFL